MGCFRLGWPACYVFPLAFLGAMEEKKPEHHLAASLLHTNGNSLFPQDGKKNMLGSNLLKFVKVSSSKLFKQTFFLRKQNSSYTVGETTVGRHISTQRPSVTASNPRLLCLQGKGLEVEALNLRKVNFLQKIQRKVINASSY